MPARCWFASPEEPPLVEAALKMLDEGASYDEVRKRFGVPASTLRRYRAALRADAN
jgi:transposase